MKEEITDLITSTAVEVAANDPATLAEVGGQISQNLLTVNNVWMMVATFLVFIMHLGFAGVEAGFGQSKNTVNILFKNTLTPLIGILFYLNELVPSKSDISKLKNELIDPLNSTDISPQLQSDRDAILGYNNGH